MEGDEPVGEDMVEVKLLEDVFSTGKTPEATYTPRTGGEADGVTFDERLRDKVRRKTGGLMIFGVSKSGKTSLAERVLPEDRACWLQGTRIASVEDFWNTLAQQLKVVEKYSAQVSDDQTRTEGDKFDIGLKPIVSVGFDNSEKTSQSSSSTWSYSNVAAQQVEDELTANPRPIILDDFHHIPPDVRADIARAIKPLLRKTFVALIAIPSHSFDPAKTVADIGGRMTNFKIPEWSEDELRAIAHRGFNQLNLTDAGHAVAKQLAKSSFGSPHVMQELCYTTLLALGIRETGQPTAIAMPDNYTRVLKDAATEAEPFAFQKILAGKNTKGEARKPIKLKSGGVTDTYGIVLMAISELIPPLILSFKQIRNKVNDLTHENVVKERIVVALRGMSSVAEQNKGGADPIFSYREEVAYIEDPLFAFHLKYGEWQHQALQSHEPTDAAQLELDEVTATE